MGSDPTPHLRPGRRRNVRTTACSWQPEFVAHARLRTMRSQLMTRRRVTAGLVAGTLLLAACGGGDDGSGEALPQAVESSDPVDSDSADTDSADTDSTPVSAGSAAVDLVGADLLASSDVEANPLPNVVVDDINTGRKVNFRNLVPQEKPILLWMWAPH